MARWILFLLTIAIGAVAGLLYGWLVSPVTYVDTTLNSLGSDYKADYVLMVAEAYHGDGNLDLAMRRLAQLGDPVPLQSVVNAISFGKTAPYAESDMELLNQLADELRAWNPALELPSP